MYLSDVIDTSKIIPGKFNLITGGCGCGKSTFCMEKLLDAFPEIEPEEMIIVTSRAITARQMSYTHDNVTRHYNGDVDIIKYWSDDYDEENPVHNPGIRVLTYDQMIKLTQTSIKSANPVLANVKMIVFDECHTLFVDEFIKGIDTTRWWLKEAIHDRGNLIVIGMTATPDAFVEINNYMCIFPVNVVNDVPLIMYKARHMICTDFTNAIKMLQNHTLPGKSLFMCNRINECAIVFELVKDSGVVISEHNKTNDHRRKKYGKENLMHIDYEPYMDEIREKICFKETLPETIEYYDKGLRHNCTRTLNTLVSTTTLREGFNMKESSGVRNVFVMATDDMEIVQFLGRCRYNIDNLVVVRPVIETNTSNLYFSHARELYSDFICGTDFAWFMRLENVLGEQVNSVEITDMRDSQNEFSDIRARATVGVFMKRINHMLSEDGIVRYIWTDDERREVVNEAFNVSLLPGVSQKKYGINRVINAIKDAGIRVDHYPRLKTSEGFRSAYVIYKTKSVDYLD